MHSITRNAGPLHVCVWLYIHTPHARVQHVILDGKPKPDLQAIMFGTASRRGKLLTSSGHGRGERMVASLAVCCCCNSIRLQVHKHVMQLFTGFVMARGTCTGSDGSSVTYWSSPYFLTLVGHGLGLSVGRERLVSSA